MISPSVKILYLIGLSVLCFLIEESRILVGLALFHVGLWCALKLPFGILVHTLRKLLFFIVLILTTFTFLPTEAMTDDAWSSFRLFGFEFSANLTGLSFGLLMSLRVLIVVITSIGIQLSGRPGEFVEGLRGLKIPTIAALTIDSTLHLLGPGGSRRSGERRGMGDGHGRGGGGGRGGICLSEESRQEADPLSRELTWKRILHGDFGFLIDLVESSLLKARAHLEATQPAINPKMLHDVAVISGLCLLMMTTKLMKVLPGVPFAPGHKLIVLIPLYILAAELTHSRWGSTITGTTVGVLSFLFGDGRFGIFEILKHITPGIVVDLTLPWLKKFNPTPSRVTLIIVGAVCAAVRLTTIIAVTLLIEAPPLFYILIVPMLVSQSVFGGVSGFVTFYLLRYLARFKQATDLQRPQSGDGERQEVTAGRRRDGSGLGRDTHADSDVGSSVLIPGQGLEQTYIKSRFIRESLVDKRVEASTTTEREIDILPYVNIIAIGGQSIMDRGKSAVFPLIDEIVKNKEIHKMIIGVGGGVRVRHTFSIAMDLGIPTGGLAHLAGAAEEQNEKMLQALLAKHGGIQLTKDHFWDIPHKLASGMIPIMIGMPPYHFWEQPPRKGRLPMNGSDFGMYIFAEALGARSLTFVKDVDGIYTEDPKKNPKAQLIRQISARRLLDMDLDDMCIERMVPEAMLNARHVRTIQIINGLRAGNLTRALNLEHIGTIVYSEVR